MTLIFNEATNSEAIQLSKDNEKAQLEVSADALSSRLVALATNNDGQASIRNFEDGDGAGDPFDDVANDDHEYEYAASTCSTATPLNLENDTDPIGAAVKVSYEMLIQLGGRPVCTFGQWVEARSAPNNSPVHRRFEPWLKKGEQFDDTDIFARQLERWWAFLRWQMVCRGSVSVSGGPDIDTKAVSRDAFETFLEDQRLTYERMGASSITSQPLFRTNMRRRWDQLPDPRTVLPQQIMSKTEEEGAKVDTTKAPLPFDEYTTKIADQLARYRFRQPLCLLANACKQTPSTTWLEYLGFELAFLETVTAARVQHEKQNQRAWKEIKTAAQNLDHMREAGADERASLAEAAMYSFLNDTAHFQYLRTLELELQDRVQWVVDQALKDEQQYSEILPRENNSEDSGATEDGILIVENSPSNTNGLLESGFSATLRYLSQSFLFPFIRKGR